MIPPEWFNSRNDVNGFWYQAIGRMVNKEDFFDEELIYILFYSVFDDIFGNFGKSGTLSNGYHPNGKLELGYLILKEDK